MEQQKESPRFLLILGSLFLFAYVAFNLGSAWMDSVAEEAAAAFTPTPTVYFSPTPSPTLLPLSWLTPTITPGGPISTEQNSAAASPAAPAATPTKAEGYPPPAEPTRESEPTKEVEPTAIPATATPVVIQPTATRTPRPSATSPNNAYPGPDDPDPYPGPRSTSTPRPTSTPTSEKEEEEAKPTPMTTIEQPSQPTVIPLVPNSRRKAGAALSTLEFIEVQAISNGPIQQAVWAPTGTRLALATSNGIYFYEPLELRKQGSLEIGAASSVTFAANDEIILAGGTDASITGWYLPDRDFVVSFSGHLLGIVRVVYSAAGDFLASGSDDATVRIWDQTGSTRWLFSDPVARVTDLTVSPNGRFVAASSNQHVHIWDPATGNLLKTIRQPLGWYNAVTFSPDSQILVTAYDDRRLEFWNTNTWARTDVIPQQEPIRWLAYSPEGTMLAAAYENGRIRIWDPWTLDLLVDMAPEGRITSLAFSPLGDQLMTTKVDGTLQIWNLAPLLVFE